jgi:DNA-binding IclR family transcriptional regulator
MDNPIHTGAMGKVLLAFSDAAEREEILDRTELVAYTPATITDRAMLDRELAKIRDAGFAESRGERSPGVAAVSAPVLGPDRRLIAALAIIGPSERLDDEMLARLRKPLGAAAREISRRVVTATTRNGAKPR